MTTITDSVAVLPPEARKQEIPFHVVLFLLGAIPHTNYKGKKDGAALELDDKFYPLHAKDYELVSQIGSQLSKELAGRIVTPADWMLAYRRASQILAEKEAAHNPEKKVIMLKDQGGAGYWRMVLPAKHMECPEVQIDCDQRQKQRSQYPASQNRPRS